MMMKLYFVTRKILYKNSEFAQKSASPALQLLCIKPGEHGTACA